MSKNFQVAKGMLLFHKEVYFCGNCFLNLVRHVEINPPPECQNQIFLVGITLTVVVVPEDYTAAITTVLRLQAEAICVQKLVSVNHLHTKTYKWSRCKNTEILLLEKGIRCIRRRVVLK